jgi:hypothetical protein
MLLVIGGILYIIRRAYKKEIVKAHNRQMDESR